MAVLCSRRACLSNDCDHSACDTSDLYIADIGDHRMPTQMKAAISLLSSVLVIIRLFGRLPFKASGWLYFVIFDVLCIMLWFEGDHEDILEAVEGRARKPCLHCYTLFILIYLGYGIHRKWEKKTARKRGTRSTDGKALERWGSRTKCSRRTKVIVLQPSHAQCRRVVS